MPSPGFATALLEPTNLLLLACALLYALIGERGEAGVLMLFVAGISLLDAAQQRRSQRALAELARLSAPRARVWRDGQALELPPEEVVPGDALRLEEGDRVAADGILEEAVGLWADTSLLSGEALPVALGPGDPILAGSLVAQGRGMARVTATASSSELGQLARGLAEVEAPLTRLQRRTRRLTARLSGAALGMCAVLALIQGVRSGDWPGALLRALALALAVLPNEIPVVVALFLALGALRLSTIGVLARWPAAVESLGGATVLAVDKTGTLTENRMAVQALLTWPEGALWRTGSPLEEPWHHLLEQALLASRGDPVDAMELALRRLADEALEEGDHRHPDWPLEREYPLEPDLLVMSRLWRDGSGQWHLAAKGAPEAVAELCHLDPRAARALHAAADGLAREGMRVLAVAGGLEGAPLHHQALGLGPGPPPEGQHAFLFRPLGLIGLADPLRPEVPEAIATARQAGVRVVMITGDGPTTARAIADQAGLPAGPPLTGGDLEGLSPAALAEAVRSAPVFARVMPRQKLQLVKALQAAGEVVAMTGDGVNDAPALKAADIGVAMGRRGSAVAREAADLVLVDDSFAPLVGALGLARRVEANLRRALGYTLAIHLPIVTLSLLPLLFSNQPLLLQPVHIALLHLVIDPACTVVFEAMPGGGQLLRQPPRPPEAPLLGAGLWRRALGQGSALGVVILALAFWPDLPLESRRSLVFGLLLLTSGGLVWLNGDRRTGHGAAGLGLGLALWLVIQGTPPLRRLLALGSLTPEQLAGLALALVVALALAALPLRPQTAGFGLQDREGAGGRDGRPVGR
ncbi:MAG: HAD-IC family P-type ATPase, partial [Cyanobacteriota bacterium]|nr:HAD-IC family P-type ATPase [Cyanobacteriota bacterium]